MRVQEVWLLEVLFQHPSDRLEDALTLWTRNGERGDNRQGYKNDDQTEGISRDKSGEITDKGIEREGEREKGGTAVLETERWLRPGVCGDGALLVDVGASQQHSSVTCSVRSILQQ